MKVAKLFPRQLLEIREKDIYGITVGGIRINKEQPVDVWKHDDFEVDQHGLTSLAGSPEVVKGTFNCADNNLTSLEHAPKKVGNFYCSRNKLKSLIGLPKVTGHIDVSHNELTSLTGAPLKVNGSFICLNNNLHSLKDSPHEVEGSFNCGGNHITSLDDAPSIIGGNFRCQGNRLTSLKDIHKIIKKFTCKKVLEPFIEVIGNSIKSHVLGLLYIPGLHGVDLNNKQVKEIINKHLPNKLGHKGVLACQSELLDAGLEDFAQL